MSVYILSDAHGGQKKVSDLLELYWWLRVAIFVLRMEPRSPRRTTSALNHWANSPAPTKCFWRNRFVTVFLTYNIGCRKLVLTVSSHKIKDCVLWRFHTTSVYLEYLRKCFDIYECIQLTMIMHFPFFFLRNIYKIVSQFFTSMTLKYFHTFQEAIYS